ncbi:MAG: hypothetical protein ACRDA5_08360 [Clostridium sp.]
MNDIGVFISNVGFPIALVCGMAWGFYKVVMMVLKPIFERFMKTLDSITDTNKTLVKTNSILADKLDKKMDKVLMEVTKECH